MTDQRPPADRVRRLVNLPSRTTAQQHTDADDELATFLAERTDHFVAQGMSPEAAHREALRRLGAPVAEAAYDLRRSVVQRERRGRVRRAWQDLGGDIRLALRLFRRDRWFAILAILIVALGVGATVTVFSIANTLVLRPLAFAKPNELVWLANNTSEGLSGTTVQVSHLQELAAQSKSLAALGGYMAFFGDGDAKLTGAGEPERLTAVGVTENFFPLLGVAPLIGRTFNQEEGAIGGPGAVLLRHGFWVRRYAADPSVVGRSLTLNGSPATVVGVLPPSFDFSTVFAPGTRADVFYPFPLAPQTDQMGNTLSLVGRLKPGTTVEQLAAELRLLAPQLNAARRDRNQLVPVVSGLHDHVAGGSQVQLLMLAGAVALVMLIVCANLAALLLARATSRHQEMTLRVALGAGRDRLVRQLLTESTVLSCAGAVVGFGLAIVGTRVVARQTALNIPLLDTLQMDARVAGFAIVLALVTGVVFGAVPALVLPSRALSEGLRGSGRGATGGRKGYWLRRSLVVSEIGLACVLMVGAGLLIRSFLKVAAVDLGYRPAQVSALRVDPDGRALTPESLAALVNETLRRTRETPGVSGAALSDALPFGNLRGWGVAAIGEEFRSREPVETQVRVISDGYLDVLGIALTSGRDLTERDGPGTEPVILVNETLARILWRGQDPLGRLVAADTARRVVGVVADTRQVSIEGSTGPEMYIPTRQSGDFLAMQLVVRSALPPNALATAVRDAIGPVIPDLAAREWRSLGAALDHALSPRRFFTWLLGGFAAFAMVLALLGIYGVVSSSVGARTREIGVRMALGATTARVQQGILRETAALAGVGLLFGGVGAWLVARLLRTVLYGVSAGDPMTFAAVGVAFTLAAVLAGYLPARRASRVDPVAALRSS